MPARTASTYNTLISHAPAGIDLRSLARHMVADGLCPDRFTVSALLSACASEREGRELHCFAVKRGMCGDGDFHVSSGFVSMYCRVSRPDLARRVFDRMHQRNVVSWTAMVGGYAENGMFEDAAKAFRAMWAVDGILPNRVALISVLSAVEGLMGLAEGKQVHGFAARMGLYGEVSLNNALVDMYAKGGALRYARRIFDDGTWRKDVISWGSMVLGYGLHGMGMEAVALFDQMHASGVKPDSIVGLGVLSACCRAGLVLKGLEIYNSLVKDHKVHPTEEMSACVVDLLGRSGLIDHALDFIKSMSVEPGPSVWGALLDASVIHSNKETEDLACRSLLRLEEESPSNLVSVSNLHASSGRWNIVEQVRAKIKHGTLKKTPGRSWWFRALPAHINWYALESLALYRTTSKQIVPLAVKRAELLYLLYAHTCAPMVFLLSKFDLTILWEGQGSYSLMERTLINQKCHVKSHDIKSFALEGCRWQHGEIGVLDLLGPHYGLLAGVPHVLHLGGVTLLVDDTVLPLGSFDGHKCHVVLELHVVVVHSQGCDLAIHCLEEDLEQDILIVLHDDGDVETGMYLRRMVARMNVQLNAVLKVMKMKKACTCRTCLECGPYVRLTWR
ncbi:hypothetical protein TRIUR3_23409 [Triticum urartu]|uniref:Pentatricopeptide repeat-containing protein n=1 Tax=Triticum urartu TaxID=4572 RepID=M7Z860_TRIUA|nr:hypothetical protein TRIUR3_23409 [Triticum urartu]